MKVLVCGDRAYADYEKIRARLSLLPPGTVIIHGDAQGADRLAGLAARDLGLKVIPVPAKWKDLGRAAGPERNDRMLALGINYVIAFHARIDESSGTVDALYKSWLRDIPSELIS
jgi:YspA, cpYpsA-related SLOG family